MEIKNRLTVTRGEEEGIPGERRGRVKSKAMYKWTHGQGQWKGGLKVGGGDWAGQGRAMEENWGQL